jgi:hypothetical protein
MNDNSPEPRGISNLREPSFTLSTRMIEAMLGDADPAPRLIALTNTRLQNSRLVSEAAMASVAESVVNSVPVMSIYAACEWDCWTATARIGSWPSSARRCGALMR